LFAGCRLYTVVKHEKSSEVKEGPKFYFEDNDFDSDQYVESIWDDKVVPYIDEKAAEITEVLKELKVNVDDAGKKYGIRSSDVGSAWNFIVRGKGKVLKVNRESRNGTLDIDLEAYDGNKDIILQIGPVFKGTSIRDSLDFIKFDDFKNQMVFASISNSMNKQVRDKVVSKLDIDNISGKEIEFTGAFTFESSGDIVVTPVKVQMAGGGE